MKKNERLIAELIFINQKRQFNLNDLMIEFSISKRTALRDISDLESLGAPITVNKGRFGGYHLIKTNSLPPLYLTQHEWHSLFLVLQIYKQMEQSPFNASYQHLKNKLLAIAPQEEYKINHQLENMIVISTTQSISHVPLLTEIFRTIYEESVLQINYSRYEESCRLIQPIQLAFKYGHWYLLAWDLDKESFRHFRCDFITSISISKENGLLLSFDELYELYLKQSKKNKPQTFKAHLKIEALDLFHSKKYPGVELIKENNQYYIIGHYHENEIPFIINYLIGFGTFLTLKEPYSLVNMMKQHLANLLKQYD
ncbi:YafY family transcriptional regulator [Vagococcus sp. DIV0080]|uniref:YafY family transcriptional regulator n=1 Tax=Candidatus Vagococcus giribetii TaxID=2230876 RepID=A0ABS3HS67_9ENTE|nr:YafY family protein [Vagococcus sp. DIV0080]MBO0476592.1 YafY family transcriptional regulator [Vagococcus sp. DIV0080]